MTEKKGVDAQKLDPNMKLDEAKAAEMVWRSPKTAPFHVAGLAWLAEDQAYRRLPVKPKHPIRPAVDSLANATAGAQIRFQSDSTRLSIRVKLRGPAGMDHMPATGQCCFDLYIGPVGAMRYFRTSRYKWGATEYEASLFEKFTPEVRPFTLNFPLYQGVEDVSVGLDASAKVLPPLPYDDDRRVIVYGTSITQGGCAARPGMAFTNILSRRFNMEFINLGFSGNGKGEPELARLILEIERPALYVLDYDANVDAPRLRETLPEFIRILRETHPTVPILVLSRIPGGAEATLDAQAQQRREKAKIQQATVARLRRRGDKNLFFKNGGDLLGKDFDECTVDGAHPTDLGFQRMADALTPVVRRLLKK